MTSRNVRKNIRRWKNRSIINGNRSVVKFRPCRPCQVRLRPILMTTAAMTFGMMPLALGPSEGSKGSATMGRSIIGGVISSSLLTLIVAPVVYTYLDGMAAWFSARRSRRITRNEQPAAAD